MSEKTTLKFLGTTTFLLKLRGLTILHDTWLDKPAGMKRWLEIESITYLDYIVISHAHFDHLPGSDRIAIKTGAKIIANCEAINRLRGAGVSDEQLIAVSGGERIPLFSKKVWREAAARTIDLGIAPPTAPPRPHHKYAVASVHVWPSLHCLMPGATPHDIPDYFDTAQVYTGSVTPYDCTLDITRNMQYGLFRLKEIMPEERMDSGHRIFADYVSDRKTNIMSSCDGGQLIYNFVVEEKALLFNTHLGAYDGILKSLVPKPKIAVLGVGGRANLNGRPFDGSAAEFLTNECKWLEQPALVLFSLHDASLIKPYYTDTKGAKEMIERETGSKTIDTQAGTVYELDL